MKVKQPMVPISVAIITYNEAHVIKRCVESILAITDDIVLVDSGSTDNTTAIAKNLGARIFVRDWPGFGPQKQFAVDNARHDWVLVLDADEVLLPEGIPLIQAALKWDQLPAGFILQRRNYFQGKHIRFGDWGRDRVLRLIDRRCGAFSPDLVHERWDTLGPVRELKAALTHYSFDNYKAMIAKLDLYSDLNAKKLVASRKDVQRIDPMAHAVAAFLKGYFLRLGFLDGTEGAGIALTTALGSFMKYAKALEMQRRSS